MSARPAIGEGKIGAFLCAAIGVLSVASVLCLRFPAFLTTPELRAHYDMGLLRLVLAVAMLAAAGLGLLAITLGGPRRLAALGLSLLLLAELLGGPYVSYAPFVQPKVYFGLDWLVLDLFFTGIFFGALEWIFPKVRPSSRRCARAGSSISAISASIISPSACSWSSQPISPMSISAGR